MEFARAASARGLLRWQSPLTRPRSWVCHPYRSHVAAVMSRRFLSEAPSPPAPPVTPATPTTPATSAPPTPADKPFYVTTPIFYVNAEPHIGHMYSMVLADVFKRWQTLIGKKAFFVTGTDEHGMKVQQAAALADKEPKQLCDENAEKFEELARMARIDYDRFMRTTDRDHVQAVEHFWFLLREKGLIYETKHEGWYSVGDECFYPESQVVKHQEPFTGAVYMASVETKNKVEWVEEKNYCFRMTELKDRLLDFYEKNPGWIEPASRMNEVAEWVKNHFEDLSISRPVQRLSWGIRVPDDPSQTIYVWVDALINYITAAGFPDWTPGESHKGGWPADVHVIGKDILRFHCVYWPALLMALDIPLPKKVLVHSHWTLNNKKMSKSVGNVVNPLYAMNRWGVDATRYYLLAQGGIVDDANYANDHLVIKYKKYLQGGLGNLLGRLTRPKAWNVRDIVTRSAPNHDADVMMDSFMSKEIRLDLHAVEQMLEGAALTVASRMEKHEPKEAIRKIFRIITTLNEVLSRREPWALVKSEKPADHAMADKVLFLVAEGLRISGILLQSFLPDKAAQLLDTLGVARDKRTFAHAVPRCDMDYGVPMVDPGSGRADGLFPPVVEDMDVEFPGSSKSRQKAKKSKRPEVQSEE